MTDYADIEPISNSDLALRCSSWRLGDRSLDPRLIWDRLNFKQKEFARSEARKTHSLSSAPRSVAGGRVRPALLHLRGWGCTSGLLSLTRPQSWTTTRGPGPRGRLRPTEGDP
jgi:hypothetical protein